MKSPSPKPSLTNNYACSIARKYGHLHHENLIGAEKASLGLASSGNQSGNKRKKTEQCKQNLSFLTSPGTPFWSWPKTDRSKESECFQKRGVSSERYWMWDFKIIFKWPRPVIEVQPLWTERGVIIWTRAERYEQKFISLYFLADLRYISLYFVFGLNK